MIVLVDTNILLDVLQRREPFHIWSDQIWKMAETGGLEVHISAISFNNVFYVLRKQAGQQVAIGAVKQLRKIFRVVGLDAALIDEAINMAAQDFEDAIQAASAQRVNADVIVTRNIKHFVVFGIHAMSSEDFVATFVP